MWTFHERSGRTSSTTHALYPRTNLKECCPSGSPLEVSKLKPQELLVKIQDCLRQLDVDANVVIKGKDTIEIRMATTDLMAETFAIKRPTVKTHIEPKAPRTTPKVEKTEASKGGFNLKLVSHSGSMTDSDLSILRNLTQQYPFISVTKLNSGVWENTCREIVLMASGLFVDSHRWDSAWLSKVEQRGGGPSLLKGKFKDTTAVINTIAECLDYVNDAHTKGSFWWPAVVRGKIPRQSILSFIVSSTRGGTDWSPMCEVLWEMNKGAALKSALPKLAVDIADTIIKESPFLSSIAKPNIAPYWEGLRKFVDWYYASKDILLSNVDNRVRLADIGMAVTLVKEWNTSASGRALPLSFIYPGSDKWFRFTQWCRTNRNVSIPDYRTKE